jgi:hypothetical protein
VVETRRDGLLRRLARLAPALLACLGLALAGWPKTPSGRHCPTAPVQTVVETRVDCCGKVVRVERKPKPGESSFVQCRCAEKKTQEAADSGSISAPLSLFGPPEPGWTLGGYLLAAPEARRPDSPERARSRPHAPPSLPPRVA